MPSHSAPVFGGVNGWAQAAVWVAAWAMMLTLQNAATPSDFFRIPPNRVVELGTKIEI